MNEIPNRILTLLLSGVFRRRHFRTLLVVSLAAGLIAVAIGTLLGTSQACKGPTNARKVAGASPGLAVEERPYLGITYVPITAHMAAYYGLSTSSGVLVTAVAPGSPAQKAGIRLDDIIVEADSQRLSNEITMIDVINRHAAGDKIDLVMIRNGEQRTSEVILAPRP